MNAPGIAVLVDYNEIRYFDFLKKFSGLAAGK